MSQIASMQPMRTADCEPSLTDTQVLEFCRKGFLFFEAVVPDDVNCRVFDFIPEHGQNALRQQDWFVDNVLLNTPVAGAVRSLLGANFALPVGISNHLMECPAPKQNWHRDGGSRYGPEVNNLQVFYYPQDTPTEMGPTEVYPGSHHLFALQSWMGHYDQIRGAISTAAPAGSIFITAYSIWHRRGASTATGTRNLLKYSYWRTAQPKRDWILDPDFDLSTHEYIPNGLPGQQFRDWYDAAAMFFWLCGDDRPLLGILGGEGWPMGYPPPRKGANTFPPEGFQRL